MTSPRFRFPVLSDRFRMTPNPVPAFVPVQAGLLGMATPCHFAAACQVYHLAWAQTQAVLMPTRFEKTYPPCLN